MSDDIALQRRSFLTRGPSWAADFPVDVAPITLDADLVLAVYPDGIIPSGAALGLNPTTGRHGPYGGTTDEVWTFTEGGSGLTSWTFTWDGNTSESLDDDATAAQVQAEADAVFGEGNVTVTGGPLATGPFTFTVNADGDLADTDVAAPTTTPTGGTGTVVVDTATAGGAAGAADGTENGKGLLLQTRTVRAGHHVDASLYYRGRIYRDLLPADSGVDDAFFADVPAIYTDLVGA